MRSDKYDSICFVLVWNFIVNRRFNRSFFLEKWQDKFKSINLPRWVCLEIILSIVLLIIYGLLKISL